MKFGRLRSVAAASLIFALANGITLAAPANAVPTGTSHADAAQSASSLVAVTAVAQKVIPAATYNDPNFPFGYLAQTANSGVPSTGFGKVVQDRWGRWGGYTGAIDGVMGGNSWKGVQRYLNLLGFNLVVDGVAGSATNKAIQTDLRGVDPSLAVDGVRGPATYRAWARDLQAAFN